MKFGSNPKTRHIDLKNKGIHQEIKNNNIKVVLVKTEDMLVDSMTKASPINNQSRGVLEFSCHIIFMLLNCHLFILISIPLSVSCSFFLTLKFIPHLFNPPLTCQSSRNLTSSTCLTSSDSSPTTHSSASFFLSLLFCPQYSQLSTVSTIPFLMISSCLMLVPIFISSQLSSSQTHFSFTNKIADLF
ncbi:hypothetical protein VP01_3083g2 [Puccinia sorghi]|uniref:Uncharacterized protein n=1 Tax=Puccinia sorghi TaxID=27349 RepID=A0A0L6UZN5_9BASI|nr:hypothetical protein VP01_3083g2 [Puccinia sorghi]